MIRFEGGPAGGTTLNLRRAPDYLRVVLEPLSGKIDALDLVEDVAEPHEKIHVYVVKPSTRTIALVDGYRGGRRMGWSELTAEYEYLEDQPADDRVRENLNWRVWVELDMARRFPDGAVC